ncbi:MAG: AtpZ/AtpI family protein [Anaerolineales bacterium]
MVDQTNKIKSKPYASLLNTQVYTITAEVGCLTLLIVLAALIGGLWIDNQFNTKPLFTIILMVASVPLTMVVLIRLVRRSMIVPEEEPDDDQPLEKEENQSG